MKNLTVVVGLCAGVVMVSAFLFGSCKSKKETGNKKNPAAYQVEVVDRKDVTVYSQFPAQIQSENTIDIYPRVIGYIQKIYVKEGDNVGKGSPILKINDADYLQAVDAAKAAYDNAELEVKKLQPLVDKEIISPLQLQTAQSNAQVAQSAYENAKINLGYTLITSPVSGVVGHISLREGSLLTAGTATLITTVASNGDAFVYFSFDEKRLLQLVADSVAGSLKEKLAKIPPVELVLANGQIYDLKGKIELGSSLIDPTTGSLQMKGVFPNPQMVLRSGGTGIIKIPIIYKNIITVPQKATYDIQDKKMIFTVDTSNVVHATNIRVINNTGDRFLIASGLSEGDKIVVDGIGKIKDGDEIMMNH
jgi:membrane fusion protein (multidrug efflux system)